MTEYRTMTWRVGLFMLSGAGGVGTNTTLSLACYGNADLQQSLVSDTVINNTASAVFNFFFGGQ
jgi:hypothetical protein